MPRISEVPGIAGSMLELFEAAGFEDAAALLQEDSRQILARLRRVNETYHLASRLPSQIAIHAWQDAAWSLEGRPGRGHGGGMQRPESLPEAIMIPESELRASGLSLDEVPLAEFPCEEPAHNAAAPEAGALHEAGFDLREQGGTGGESPEGASEPAGSPKSGGSVERGVPPRLRRSAGKDASGRARNRFRRPDELAVAPKREGRRNLGMSHPDAGQVRLAAWVTLVVAVLGVLAAAFTFAVPLVVHFTQWEIPLWVLIVPGFIPVGAVFYLLLGTRARCRLCGHTLFLRKRCRLHEKARRSILGYVLTMAFDAAFRGVYRCIYCGMKTRLGNPRRIGSEVGRGQKL